MNIAAIASNLCATEVAEPRRMKRHCIRWPTVSMGTERAAILRQLVYTVAVSEPCGAWLMKTYSVQEARNCLDDLLDAAHQGEEIVIKGEPDRAVKLLPTGAGFGKPLRAGSAKGLIKMAEDFDAPLIGFDPYRQ